MISGNRGGRDMECRVSVIIPNRNGASTISHCLEAVCGSNHPSFEVIVVDDCSEDHSVDIIRRYPCRLIQLSKHKGAVAARNEGARNARGRLLFFIDADCVVLNETLSQVDESCSKMGNKFILGGTYTCRPFDDGFFSLFQSVFIHYSELKTKIDPDYIATHAMALFAQTFRESGGFDPNFALPIIEDVEYSHRLHRQGYRLMIDPEIQVLHIFNFSLIQSIKNGYRKAKYWTFYSLGNKDIFKDSGCASHELKINVFSLAAAVLAAILHLGHPQVVPFSLIILAVAIGLFANRHLLCLFHKTAGTKFMVASSLYYSTLYAAAVGSGSLAGLFRYCFELTKPFKPPALTANTGNQSRN